MNICLIMDNPETPRHPVIGVVLQKLSTKHRVLLLDVSTLTGAQAIAHAEMRPLADLYLLKSHAPQALEVAHHVEQRGALVINCWSASVACQNRALMTQRMVEAGLPWPHSWIFPSLRNLLEHDEILSTSPFPLVIKSSYSYRGDLVDTVHNVEELRALVPRWSQEAVIIQEFAVSDGWDIKLWVIDGQIFAARRCTPLEPGAPKEDFPLKAEELPGDWIQLTLEVGRVFNLRLYGVDLLITEQGPIMVDVNSFPGFRGVQGADSALVAFVEQLCRER